MIKINSAASIKKNKLYQKVTENTDWRSSFNQFSKSSNDMKSIKVVWREQNWVTFSNPHAFECNPWLKLSDFFHQISSKIVLFSVLRHKPISNGVLASTNKPKQIWIRQSIRELALKFEFKVFLVFFTFIKLENKRNQGGRILLLPNWVLRILQNSTEFSKFLRILWNCTELCRIL